MANTSAVIVLTKIIIIIAGNCGEWYPDDRIPYYEDIGDYVCDDCIENYHRCDDCGSIIFGDYAEVHGTQNGHIICEACSVCQEQELTQKYIYSYHGYEPRVKWKSHYTPEEYLVLLCIEVYPENAYEKISLKTDYLLDDIKIIKVEEFTDECIDDSTENKNQGEGVA